MTEIHLQGSPSDLAMILHPALSHQTDMGRHPSTWQSYMDMKAQCSCCVGKWLLWETQQNALCLKLECFQMSFVIGYLILSPFLTAGLEQMLRLEPMVAAHAAQLLQRLEECTCFTP
jgi:uncharacterized membrane protein